MILSYACSKLATVYDDRIDRVIGHLAGAAMRRLTQCLTVMRCISLSLRSPVAFLAHVELSAYCQRHHLQRFATHYYECWL